MQTKFRKSFLKQLAKLPKDVRERIEAFVFDELPNLNVIGESGKIEKMQGYESYFKIRFGSYRVGLKLEDTEIIVQIVMHRKEIYRFFPWNLDSDHNFDYNQKLWRSTETISPLDSRSPKEKSDASGAFLFKHQLKFKNIEKVSG